MELTKGRNMLEHESEIMSRPARTWFQTTVEKAAAKSAGLAEHNLKFAEKKQRPSFKDREGGNDKEREKDVSQLSLKISLRTRLT